MTRSKATPAAAGRIAVENVIRPGKSYFVNATMYHAMRRAVLKVLPSKEPGLTPAEMLRAVPPHLPEDLYPGGAKAGWWLKAVQLDLEAKGIITRAKQRPVRLHRA